MQEYIIGNIVRPEDRRDVYQEMGLAAAFKGYVRAADDEEPRIGEHSSYVQELSEEQVEEIRARVEAGEIGNLRYLEPNGTVTTDELEVQELGEDVGPGAVLEAASLKYMGADGLTEDGWDGTGVWVAVGNGGTSRAWRQATRLVPKKTHDFVSNRTATHLQVEAGGTQHGCYVAPHCVPVDAEYYEAVVFNSKGSATWADVARFFRWCGDNGVDVANFSGSGDGLAPNKAGLIVMGATRGNGKPGHPAQVVAQALVNTARDTPEPVREEGAGAWDLRRALAKLEPQGAPRPERPDWFPELPRVPFGRFGDDTVREVRQRGDCVITIGRDRKDFGVFRLKGGS